MGVGSGSKRSKYSTPFPPSPPTRRPCPSARLEGVCAPHLGPRDVGRYGEIWVCAPHLGHEAVHHRECNLSTGRRLGGGGRWAGRLARRKPAAEHGVGRRRGAGSRDQVGDLSVPAGRINFAAPGRLVELVGKPVPGDLGRHGAQRDRGVHQVAEPGAQRDLGRHGAQRDGS